MSIGLRSEQLTEMAQWADGAPFNPHTQTVICDDTVTAEEILVEPLDDLATCHPHLVLRTSVARHPPTQRGRYIESITRVWDERFFANLPGNQTPNEVDDSDGFISMMSELFGEIDRDTHLEE